MSGFLGRVCVSCRLSSTGGGPRILSGASTGRELLVDDQLVEQLHGVRPGLRARLALIECDRGRAEDLVLDGGVIRALELGLDSFGAFAQDGRDRSSIEEGRDPGRGRERRIRLRCDNARERALRLERGDLLVLVRQPGGLLRVLGLLRDSQERPTPVGCATGEDVCEVPACGRGVGVAACGLDLTLNDAEHPARAHERGELAVDERLTLVPVPLCLLGREPGRVGGGELRPAILERLVVGDVELARAGVVTLRQLVHHRVPDETGLVEPGLTCRLLVLRTDGEVLVPGGAVASEERGNRRTIGRKTGGREQLAVVAQALRTDVGPVADDATTLVGSLSELPRHPAVLDLVCAEVLEVVELVGDVLYRPEPTL